MIKLVIVEDHPAIAEGLGALLATEPDVEMLGIARDRDAAAQLIENSGPDVVLCDIALESATTGFELLARYGRRGRPAFVMFSAHEYPSYYARAVQDGAMGYVSKTANLSQIMVAVRAASRGEKAFGSGVLRAARAAPRPPSERELEVIRLVGNGQTNEQVAFRLGLSVKTIESHLRRLYTRYGTTNRAELTMLAVREGWVQPSAHAAEV